MNMLLGACGDDCSSCPRYNATLHNDTMALHAVAELWYRAGYRTTIVPSNELVCHGCATAIVCGNGIRDCAKGRSIDNCGQCPERPCERLTTVLTKTRANVERCAQVCSAEEYDTLTRAFFSKEENLARVSEGGRS